MKFPDFLPTMTARRVLSVITVASLLLPFGASAQTGRVGSNDANESVPAATKLPNEEAAKRKSWQRALIRTPRPNSTGCFTATYPEKQWREVPCKPSTPHKPFLPQQGGMSQLDTVGGAGPDFSATVTGHITQAEGSFDSVSNVTSANVYSLQLNTDRFATSACGGSPNAGCRGWEQFVYESAGSAFIQYWLLGWGPVGTMCPTPRGATCTAGSVFSDGWCPFQIDLSPGDPNPIQCAINAAQEPPNVAAEPMTSLGQLQLAGAAAAGGATTDSITVIEGGTGHSSPGNNRFPDLGSQWQEAEFNVFGGGNSSEATFNSGANIVVRTEVISGDSKGPGCHLRSWTGESNNLTLSNSPPLNPAPQPAPALVFGQVNPAPTGVVASCADAISLGDTHLTTFGGLLYDFQASGDFILAETGPDFLVQTRQISGAPSWPNASVNKAVAVQAGQSRVAICLPGRVVVDGKTAEIPDGGRVGLSGGGNVIRKANAYYVLAPSGSSIRAEVNDGWINVSVGLGRWPVKVGGLLANANGNVNQIATRDGIVLTNPFSFEELYHLYADSWRVGPRGSLLSVCGEQEIVSGIPTKPFYANDLDPRVYEHSRALCAAAGVTVAPLLQACTLDVAVIGSDKAAPVFAGMRAPVAVGTPFGLPHGSGQEFLLWLLLLFLLAFILWVVVLKQKP